MINGPPPLSFFMCKDQSGVAELLSSQGCNMRASVFTHEEGGGPKYQASATKIFLDMTSKDVFWYGVSLLLGSIS